MCTPSELQSSCLLDNHQKWSIVEPLPINSMDSTVSIQMEEMEKPKRPLSAYNYFFQQEREAILSQIPTPVAQQRSRRSKKGHGKVGFAELAHIISARWRQVDPERLAYVNQLAANDKARYRREMKAYKEAQKKLSSKKDMESSLVHPNLAQNEAYDPSIAHLARQLDQSSIDFLIRALR